MAQIPRLPLKGGDDITAPTLIALATSMATTNYVYMYFNKKTHISDQEKLKLYSLQSNSASYYGTHLKFRLIFNKLLSSYPIQHAGLNL